MKCEIIKNRARVTQIAAFDGMEYGKCRPTDVDFAMDFQGRTFIFGEIKGGGVPLTMGQRLFLQAMVDGLRAGGKKAIAIMVTHDTPDPDEDIHVAESPVACYYDGSEGRGKWKKPEAPVNCHDFIKSIHEKHIKGLLP